MKIEKAIMSVDDNLLYSDFWLHVSKVWKQRFDIEPVLIYFGEKDLDDTYGTVIKIKPLSGFPLYLQTQWARFWYTTVDPETVFIVSDIDMFPISHDYFINQIKEIDENKYVHLWGDHRPIPVCYHVAKGKQFKKILNLSDSFCDSMHDLNQFDAKTITTHMGFTKWGIEEAYCTEMIEKTEYKDELVFLPRPEIRRIDRTDWRYDLNTLKNIDYYIDCHSVRPYEKYKEEIDRIVDTLIQ